MDANNCGFPIMTAFRQGWDAFEYITTNRKVHQRQHQPANPYSPSSDEHREWHRGWNYSYSSNLRRITARGTARPRVANG